MTENLEHQKQQTSIGEYLRNPSGIPAPERPFGEDQQRLMGMNRMLNILKEPGTGKDGQPLHWTQLYKNLGSDSPDKNLSVNSALELSNQVRNTVYDFIAEKVPSLKDKEKGIYSLNDLTDTQLAEAMVHNWFEDISDKIEGQRRQVLLATASHIVKRIESHTYKEILSHASDETLEKLGLNKNTRDLLVDLLNTSLKADALFIRYLAYSHLGPEQEENGTQTSLVTENGEQHTLAEVFPRESQALGRGFKNIAEEPKADDELDRKNKEWQNEPNADKFRKYLFTLSEFFLEKNPERQKELLARAHEENIDLLKTDFPIIMVHPTEGWYNPPHLDPELRIGLATPETRADEQVFAPTQQAMADSLSEIHAEQFSESMRNEIARSVILVGSFGVNTVFNAVAQETPSFILFVDENYRQFEKSLPDFFKLVKNTAKEFPEGTLDPAFMVRACTMMHEYSHAIYPDDRLGTMRFGLDEDQTLAEIKAENLFRAMIPHMIRKGGLPGTREQWAIAGLTTSLQFADGEEEGSPYYLASTYALNDSFADGTIVIKNGKFEITDFDRYDETMHQHALEIMGLFNDASMDQKRIKKWIKENCTPNKQVLEALKIARKLRE